MQGDCDEGCVVQAAMQRRRSREASPATPEGPDGD